MSACQTEGSLDALADPWLMPPSTTMTTNSIETPILLDAESATTEERTETQPAGPSETNVDQSGEMEKHLTKQIRELAQEVKRMRSQAAVTRALERADAAEVSEWTSRQLHLVQKAVGQWKRLRSFSMAERILAGAAGMREANVIV